VSKNRGEFGITLTETMKPVVLGNRLDVNNALAYSNNSSSLLVDVDGTYAPGLHALVMHG
jgi:hypothetical protein